MSAPFVRLPSDNAGSFTTGNNIVRWTVPEGQTFDLSRSFIDVYLSITSNVVDPVVADPVTDNDGGAQVAIPRLAFTEGGVATNMALPPQFLIRRASLLSARLGKLEEIDEARLLKVAMYLYKHGVSARDGDGYRSTYQSLTYGYGLQSESVWRELHKENNNIPSRELSSPIQISLADVFDFCRSGAVDTTVTGKLTIEMELRLDTANGVNATQVLIAPDSAAGLTFQNVVNTGAAALTITSLQTTHRYTSDLSPFYTGQKFLISTTIGDPAVTTANRALTINQIVNEPDGTLTLTFNKPVTEVPIPIAPVPANLDVNTLRDIHVEAEVPLAAYPDSFTLSWPKADIVLKATAAPGPQIGQQMAYRQVGVEHYSGSSGLTICNKSFVLPPATQAVFVTFHATPDSKPLSQVAGLTYRLRLGGRDVMPYTISMNEGLHYVLLSQAFSSAGEQLNAPRARADSQTASAGGASVSRQDTMQSADNDVSMIGFPVKMSSQETIFDLQARTTAAFGLISVYRVMLTVVQL